MKYFKSKSHIENTRKAQKLALLKLEKQKLIRIEKYNLNPNKCNCCNSSLPYNKKNNKFCSSSCAATLNNKKNGKRSEKTKEKISRTLKKRYPNNNYDICKNCGKKFEAPQYNKPKYCSDNCLNEANNYKDYNNHYRNCEKCGKKFKVHKLNNGKLSNVRYCSDVCRNSYRPINKYNKNPRICKHCNNEFLPQIVSNNRVSKTNFCSIDCKNDYQSKQMKEKAKIGLLKGWNSRNIISYPENFFIDVLNNNNICFEHNYPINKRNLGLDDSTNYFLDFYIKEKNIDLEIDGKQHKYRKEHDKIRDDQLTKNGIIVYRIKWKNINNEKGKEYIRNEINKFLEFYDKN